MFNVSRSLTTPAAESSGVTLAKLGAFLFIHGSMPAPISVAGTQPTHIELANQYLDDLNSEEIGKSLTRMNQSSGDALILQDSSPFADEHVEGSSGNTVRIIEPWHSFGKLDRSQHGSYEDELLFFASTDKWEEGSNEDSVVNDFKLQFLLEQWEIPIPDLVDATILAGRHDKQFFKKLGGLVVHTSIVDEDIKTVGQEF
jgi:hypothetical protein